MRTTRRQVLGGLAAAGTAAAGAWAGVFRRGDRREHERRAEPQEAAEKNGSAEGRAADADRVVLGAAAAWMEIAGHLRVCATEIPADSRHQVAKAFRLLEEIDPEGTRTLWYDRIRRWPYGAGAVRRPGDEVHRMIAVTTASLERRLLDDYGFRIMLHQVRPESGRPLPRGLKYFRWSSGNQARGDRRIAYWIPPGTDPETV